MVKLSFCDIKKMSEYEYREYYSLMTDEKQKRVDRFVFSDDKKRTVAGDMLARKAISDYLCVSEEEIQLVADKKGKPIARGLNVNFSISHSKDFALCAVSDIPVGVDIQHVKTVKPRLMAEVCMPNELDYINNESNEANRLIRFFSLWTLKEAYIKLMGLSLAEMSRINVMPYLKYSCKTECGNYVYSVLDLKSVSEDSAVE